MSDEVKQPPRARSQPPGWRTPPASEETTERTCTDCHYDLTGLAVGQACPACGNEIRPMVGDLPTPWAASDAFGCGIVSLFGCVGWRPLMVASPVLAAVGMVFALWARAKIRQAPGRFANHSWSFARVGFWLCVPGVIALLVIVLNPLVRWI